MKKLSKHNISPKMKVKSNLLKRQNSEQMLSKEVNLASARLRRAKHSSYGCRAKKNDYSSPNLTRRKAANFAINTYLNSLNYDPKFD
jgi:hypothetical protein